jgi:hypothetical protein
MIGAYRRRGNEAAAKHLEETVANQGMACGHTHSHTVSPVGGRSRYSWMQYSFVWCIALSWLSVWG